LKGAYVDGTRVNPKMAGLTENDEVSFVMNRGSIGKAMICRRGTLLKMMDLQFGTNRTMADLTGTTNDITVP
jgi:hypothetical protein